MYEICNVTAQWGCFFTHLSFSLLSLFQKLEVFTKLHLLPHLYTCRCPNLKQNLAIILSVFPNIILIDDPFLDFDHFLVRCWFQLCFHYFLFVWTPTCLELHHPLLFAISQLKLTVSPLPHTPPACPLTFPTSSPSDLAQIVHANDVWR